MTYKQAQRLKLVRAAAEKLRVAKKEARAKAKAEAKAFYLQLYDRLKREAVQEYYHVLSKSVDTLKEEAVHNIINSMEIADDEDDLILSNERLT